MIGMTKSEIDNYINHNYSFLMSISAGLTYKRRRNIDPTIYITEAYLHCIKNKDNIESIDQLQRWMIAKMNLEISFNNAKTNRENLLHSMEYITYNESDEGLEYSIQTDINQMRQRGILRMYRLGLRDDVKKIIFDTIIEKRIIKVRDFATYFKFSNRTSHELIKEFKRDIRDFADKHGINYKNLN